MCAAASALTRSAGVSAAPTLGWSRPTNRTLTPSGSSVSKPKLLAGSNGWNSGRSGRSGVNRQSSSRPVGTPNASGSVEVNRSAGEPVLVRDNGVSVEIAVTC